MTRRVRNTKSLAKRMDLQYFTKPHPLRNWKRWLSIGVPVAALVVLVAVLAWGRGQKVYSSGPVSAPHAFFGKKCELCHVTTGFFHKEVKDTACLSCHDAPAHHPMQATFTPTCGTCHVEHQSSSHLAHTADAGCTQCHSDLKVKSGDVKFVKDVNGFYGDHHPEFAAKREGFKDPGTVKLNHYAHLHDKIAGPGGPKDLVQMMCSDCHRPASDTRPWPYARTVEPCPPGSNPTATPELKTVAMQEVSRDPDPRAYMQPIKYATQCAGCHYRDLQYDKRFSDSVPHCQTDVVQKYLIEKYTQYFAAHPNALSEPLNINRVDLSSLVVLPWPPKTRDEWIKWQVANADRLLYDKGCKLCHQMVQQGEGQIPTVAKSDIPVRWFQHADFDHDAHRMVECASCHSKAPTSKLTADVLVPDIKSCQSCHKPGGAQHDAADGRCSECHSYHDWQKEQSAPKKEFSIPQLRSSAAGM